MGWILLEALFALVVGVAIVWWTMAGRHKSPPATRESATKPDDRQ